MISAVHAWSNIYGSDGQLPRGEILIPARPAAAAWVGVLLASAAGCASGASPAATPSAPTPSVSASPADARTPLQILAAGIPTDTSAAYHYSMTGTDGPTTGVIDPATKTAEYDVVSYYHHPDYTMTLKVLLIGPKSWARVVLSPSNISGFSYIPRKWMALDPDKFTTPDTLPFGYQQESDPAFARDILASVGTVTQTSPGHFTGTTDLTGSDSDIVGVDRLTALGAKAMTLHFTAALDTNGRLSNAAVTMPASKKYKAFTFKLTYDQYFTAHIPKAPTGTTKAIPEVYQWLGY